MSAERAGATASGTADAGAPRGRFYVFHGDQEFLRAEELARLKGQIVQDGIGDLNIATLDGRTATIQEVINASNTVPFLTDRRLIIVENLLQRAEKRRRSGRQNRQPEPSEQDESEPEGGEPQAPVLDMAPLVDYLAKLPPFARLLFVEDRALNKNHPVLKAAAQWPHGYVREFRAPPANDLPAWVARRAADKAAAMAGAGTASVAIDRRAAALLASYIGDDLRALDLELEKLIAYASSREGDRRVIAMEDVEALVSAALETDIFGMVDALGLRQGKRALDQLRALLASGANELYLLAMVSRQMRLIIAAKELAEGEGLDASAIRRELGISHQFIVDKLLAQAKQFEMGELAAIMCQLVEIDEAIKTGRIDGGLALEMLTLDICSAAPGGTPALGGPYQPNKVSRTR